MIRFSARMLAIAVLFSGTAAYAEELPWWVGERRIIGQNDLEPVRALRGTEQYNFAQAVVRVETSEGSGFCTGSRVGPDLVLTNFHCYEVRPCNQIQFHFGYEDGLGSDEQQVVKCAEVLSHSLSLDYALYRVEIDSDLPDPDDFNTRSHAYEPNLSIPDNDNNGVEATLNVAQAGELKRLEVGLTLKHTYIGDLTVSLTSPEGTTVVLHDRAGGGQNDIVTTYRGSLLEDLLGEEASGDWKIKVVDSADRDVGVLEKVSLKVSTPRESFEDLDFPILSFWAGDLDVGQTLMIASHPSARLKEVDRSSTCVLRTTEVEIRSERKTITHTCDTEGGSSGSPVIDRESGRIVALHWGGTNEYNLSIPIKLVLEDIESSIAPEDFDKLSIYR